MYRSKIPRHIAIIMDGNGRWARRRGLPRILGHREGVKTIKRILKACLELGVEYLTLYTFSTENWKRPRREVKALMYMLSEYIDKRKKLLDDYDRIRIRIMGRWWELPPPLPQKIDRLIKETANNKGLNLILALNYGGRRELLDAVEGLLKDIVQNKKSIKIDEDFLRRYLYLPDVPDPDLVIRTAGEYRVSNFLLWQISYSELYITERLWPDFRKKDLLKAIESYRMRKRKFGGL